MIAETETIGRKAAQGDSASFKCSHNQATIGRMVELEGRFRGDNKSKGAKVERRKQAHREFMDEFPKQQLERCLTHMMDEEYTDEEMDYVWKHIGEHEQPLGCDSEIAIFELTALEIIKE